MIDSISWDKQKTYCIQIIDELLQHPIAKIFRQPIKCHLPSKSNPNNIPPQTLNLEIIKNRTNETYQSYQDWLLDMKLFFTTITHRNVNYLYKISANELNEKFEKKLKCFEYLNDPKWTEKCHQLKSKIDFLLKNSPDIIKNCFPSDFTIDFESTKFTNVEADYLARCSDLVKSSSDILSVINIIKNDPAQINFDAPNVSINIRNLHKKTLFLLFTFFQKRFPEEPIVPRKIYPVPTQ
ncbi:hypothetical protein M9Y10_027405 [Tritrichomonas musculus]|uniref:Bromo domain-containing protein n=1 Tax=Tritrichomonas musculus TaxID=1915356 RepID=A0ABR2H723_9EUKA